MGRGWGQCTGTDPRRQASTGAAQRRKQRRLRSRWRHEQQSIAAALATSLHHSSRGQRKARAGEEESETKYTAKFRTTHPPQPVLFSLYDEEPGGRRPASLAEPPGATGAGPEAHHGAYCRLRLLCSQGADPRRSCAADGENSCQTSSVSSTRPCLIPSRLSQCPRSFLRTCLCLRLFANRSWWNRWWKCRLLCLLPCRSTRRRKPATIGAAGRTWFQVSGPHRRCWWWLLGSRHPGGYTARPGWYGNTGQG